MTDEGVKKLAALKKLVELDLSATKVSEKMVAELRKALPKCQIQSDK